MISTPMPWIRQLEQFVPPGSLTKGRNYFRSGAVEIHEASADRVEATVKGGGDRKSTRLNSSHITISYAVFCLKKKKKKEEDHRNHTRNVRTRNQHTRRNNR